MSPPTPKPGSPNNKDLRPLSNSFTLAIFCLFLFPGQILPNILIVIASFIKSSIPVMIDSINDLYDIKIEIPGFASAILALSDIIRPSRKMGKILSLSKESQ